MEKNVDLADVILLVEIFMKENSMKIKLMVLENTDLVMEEYIKGIFLIIRCMVLDILYGLMEKNI